jgi:hypothetical protein
MKVKGERWDKDRRWEVGKMRRWEKTEGGKEKNGRTAHGSGLTARAEGGKIKDRR